MSYTREEAMAHLQEKEMQGWSDLVNQAYDLLGEDYSVSSIHQKYAKLQISFTPYDESIGQQISAIEERSVWHCEICGAPADWVIIDEWEYTRCPAHSEGASEREDTLASLEREIADVDEHLLFYLRRRLDLSEDVHYGCHVRGVSSPDAICWSEEELALCQKNNIDPEMFQRLKSLIERLQNTTD